MRQKFLTGQAIIIAAGKGMRMRPLTLERPKPLLPVAGKPILEWTLDQLLGIVDHAILVVGYKGEQIQEHFGARYKTIRLTYVWQRRQLGTGDAVQKAAKHLHGKFLLLYGDDMYAREDIEKLLEKFPSILLARIDSPASFGVVITERGVVKELEEKPEHPRSNLVNTGVYFLDSSILNSRIEKSPRGEYEFTDYIKHFIKRKKLYFAVADHWMPISTPEGLKAAEKFKQSLLAQVSP